MSGGSSVEHIDAADAYARVLYLRAKESGSPFDDVVAAVRQLHLALRHLHVEAADLDSPVNLSRPDASIYARQLKSMIEDCDFSLKQLETLLDRYGDGRPTDDEEARRSRLAVLRKKLLNDKTQIDLFLDTVQLRYPANKPDHVLDANQTGLEDIKDKVDEIASRLFQRRDIGDLAEDEDGLWQEFKAGLEKEGFSPQVLRKNKEILRAYIRELQSMSSSNGGTYPTVRGLLEHEAKTRPSSNSKEAFHPIDNDKYPTSIKNERRLPSSAPADTPNRSSYEKHSSSSTDESSDTSDTLALISTNELLAMDKLNNGIAGMHLQAPDLQQFGFSPYNTGQRFLPPNASGYLPGPPEADMSSSPNRQILSASPRFVPPFSPQTAGGFPPPPPGSSPRPLSHLAPDRYGQEIPVDAQWTKIKRTLVSPEVLERAGVRYEARPEFVAILGRLTRDQIADFARQSADARAARSARSMPHRYERHERADSKSSREDDDEDSVLWDESDSTDDDDDKTSSKGTKSYPFIVNPPDKNRDKASPSSTVKPKPILKNRNENHVRFDPEPYEVENKSPRSFKDDRHRDRERDKDRRHGSSQSASRRHDRESNSRYSESADRRGGRSSDRHGDYYSSSSRRSHRDRGDRRSDRRDERAMKKKAWGETLGAVGIGGAAVSLLSVLAEAASAV